MSDVWYYAQDDKSVGPLTLAELTTVLSQLSFANYVLVWKAGSPDWVKAENVTELSAVFSKAIPKPPPLPSRRGKQSNELAADRGEVEQSSTDSTGVILRKIKRWVIFASILGGLIWFVQSANDRAQKEEEAKQKYLAEHPLTAKQSSANEHFSTCWKYNHMPSSVWSDNQRTFMLSSEGCYSDNRDDPRYSDATYPFNGNAPQPWKK